MDDRVVVEFDQHSPEYRETYPAKAHELREQCPVVWSSRHDGFWVVTGHEVLSAISKRTDLLSNDHDPDGERNGYAGISIPERHVMSSDSTNVSLVPVGVEILRLLGAYLRVFDPDFDPKGDAAMDTYRIAAKRARNNGWANEKHWGWDREQAAQAAEQFAPSNQHFAHTMWQKDWTIPMPVNKPQSVARLTDLTADERFGMQRFINGMVKVYVELISNPRYARQADEID